MGEEGEFEGGEGLVSAEAGQTGAVEELCLNAGGGGAATVLQEVRGDHHSNSVKDIYI